MRDEQMEAMEIERKAWKLIDAFDTAAKAMGGGGELDRRIPYAAFIMMVTSFIKTSPAAAETILGDFNARVLAGTQSDASMS